MLGLTPVLCERIRRNPLLRPSRHRLPLLPVWACLGPPSCPRLLGRLFSTGTRCRRRLCGSHSFSLLCSGGTWGPPPCRCGGAIPAGGLG